MKAILTGGTGFIGRQVVAELLNAGTDVTILTSTPPEKLSGLQDFSLLKIIHTTYRYDELTQKLSDEKYDIFYHLGWAGVDAKDKNDISMQLSNIRTSLDMLKLSRHLECNLFLAAGTVAEYVFNEHIIDFTKKQTPNDVYGAVKTSVHYLLEIVAEQLGQDMIWTVLPSTYGEGRTTGNILTYTITTLLEGSRPKYGNLQSMWDFAYVTDVAKAIIKIAESGRHNMTYGIGSGTHQTLRKYICTIRDLIDPKLPLGIGELENSAGKRGDMNILPSSCINIEPLTRDTGWKPAVTFEEGIKKTIQYYKDMKMR